MSDKACKTPLIDLLRGVPKDAVVSYKHSPTEYQNIPCGGLCNEAADEIESLRREVEQQRKYKDAAYMERNRLVALLSKIYPSGKKKTAIEGWSEDWHGCVYIDFPWGQASWHFHDSQAFLFDHLPEYKGAWDGHTTEEKYAAIDAAMWAKR